MSTSLTVFGPTISTPTISKILCYIVFKCFGFSEVTPSQIEGIMSSVVWNNLGRFMLQQLSQSITVWGSVATLTLFTAVGGIPLAVTAPMLEIVPAARMVTKCACDIILILHSAYSEAGPRATVEQIRQASKLYSSKRVRAPGGRFTSRRKQVHDEVHALLPVMTVKVYKGLQIHAVTTGIEEIIDRNKFGREDDLPKLSLDTLDSDDLGDLEDLKEWDAYRSKAVELLVPRPGETAELLS